MGWDLSRIGLLMVGVALVVFAGLAIHFYVTFILQRMPPVPPVPEPFYAYCRWNAVLIHANQELRGLRVLDNRSNVICSFERIAAGSDELCMVGGRGFYAVQVGDSKKIVECLKEGVVKID